MRNYIRKKRDIALAVTYDEFVAIALCAKETKLNSDGTPRSFWFKGYSVSQIEPQKYRIGTRGGLIMSPNMMLIVNEDGTFSAWPKETFLMNYKAM